MISNLCIEAVCDEVRAAGAEPIVRPSGKHAAITWQANGVERVYHTALTPSDRRSHMNARADVRRMLRADGLLATNDDCSEPGDRPRLELLSGEPRVSSRDVAAHFGKMHKNVLRDIDRLLEDLGPEYGRLNFEPSSYLNEQNKSQREFRLSRDGFTLLAMGFTGPEAVAWKVRYLEAFNAMEAELRSVFTPALPADALARIEKLEGDLSALVDLCLNAPQPEPGYVIIKAHKRKVRSSNQGGSRVV